MKINFKRSHACTATLSVTNPAAGHHQPTPPLETPGHSQTSLGQSLVGGYSGKRRLHRWTSSLGISSSSHILGALVLGSNQGKASHLGGLEGSGANQRAAGSLDFVSIIQMLASSKSKVEWAEWECTGCLMVSCNCPGAYPSLGQVNVLLLLLSHFSCVWLIPLNSHCSSDWSERCHDPGKTSAVRHWGSSTPKWYISRMETATTWQNMAAHWR